ncbi:hypothetical protein [Helicobacter pylori]|nr:hypothetical protein [Helicobacter pylori]
MIHIGNALEIKLCKIPMIRNTEQETNSHNISLGSPIAKAFGCFTI